MKYQESYLRLGLYSSLTSVNNLNLFSYFFSLLNLDSSLLTISSIVAVFIAKAGHVWDS